MMDWLRAMAAQKPVLYLLKLPETTGSLAEATSHYLKDALFRGFIPDLDGGSSVSALSRLGAAERAAFATYQPLCRRLAVAGWNPVSAAQVVGAAILPSCVVNLPISVTATVGRTPKAACNYTAN